MCVRVFMYCACVLCHHIFVGALRSPWTYAIIFRRRFAQPMNLRNHVLLALCACLC